MNPGNDQLATFRYDLKQLTSLTLIPNIALNVVKFYSCLSFIEYKNIFCKNYDFRTSDVNKTSIMTSKFIILHFKGIHNAYAFSGERMVKWRSFGYS